MRAAWDSQKECTFRSSFRARRGTAPRTPRDESQRSYNKPDRSAFSQPASDCTPVRNTTRSASQAERADSFFAGVDGATLGAEEFNEAYAEKEGDVIGNYKLLQKIGEGGFGVVYMADQLRPVKRRICKFPPCGRRTALVLTGLMSKDRIQQTIRPKRLELDLK